MARRRRGNNVVLIGFLGIDKAKIGTTLAEKLNYRYLDLDQLIELRSNLTIPQFIKRFGEGNFHVRERRILSSLTGLRNVVLSTGSGAVFQAANRARMRTMGKVVHLKLDPNIMLANLDDDKYRPFVKSKTKQYILRFWERKHNLYSFADVEVDITGRSPEAVVDEIIDRLELTPFQLNPLPSNTITVDLDNRSYDIHLGVGIMKGLGPVLRERFPDTNTVAVITHPLVKLLYGNNVRDSLEAAGFSVHFFTIPEGEKFKRLDTAEDIYDFLMDHYFDNTGLLIALGGGMVTDITGFVALTYKRGVRWIPVPTTFMAQVDAAIGGKVSVNRRGKNILGSYYQPSLVYSDIEVLKTLPINDIKEGLVEVVKYGIVMSPELFDYVEAHLTDLLTGDLISLYQLVEKSSQLKAKVVSEDEHARGVRQTLMLGHTVGYTIESVTRHRVSHGKATNLGILAATLIAYRMGLIDLDTTRRIIRLLLNIYPAGWFIKFHAEEIETHLRQHKRIKDGKISMVLPTKIGAVTIRDDIPVKLVYEVFRDMVMLASFEDLAQKPKEA